MSVYSKAERYPPVTRTVLHLGGDPDRLRTTITFMVSFTDAHLIVSSESDPARVIRELDAAGISRDRYTLDFAAIDTVENFTKTLPLVLARGTTNLIIITAAGPKPLALRYTHIGRALRIAHWIYWRRGVLVQSLGHFAPVSPQAQAAETRWSHLRDAVRAFVARFTGIVIPWGWQAKRRRDVRNRAEVARRILSGGSR